MPNQQTKKVSKQRIGHVTRKTRARRKISTANRSRSISTHQARAQQKRVTALKRQVNQAKTAEKKAIQRYNLLVKKTKLLIEKVRRQWAEKLSKKLKEKMKERKNLVKQNNQRIQKIHKEHTKVLKAVRKNLSEEKRKLKQFLGALSVIGSGKQKTTKATHHRKAIAKKKRITTSKKVVPFVQKKSHRKVA